MTLPTREGLVMLARKYDALIITDDVYDFLQWSTDLSAASAKPKALLPRLVDIDRNMDPAPSTNSFGNAMSNGSFSKIAGPGVRTGWAEAAPKFVYGLSQCGSSRSGGAPSQLTATTMTELLKAGDLAKHIEQVLCPAYQQRHRIIQEAIEKHLFPLGVTLGEVSVEGKAVFGGYFIWIELPKDVSATMVAETAREEENLIIAPGHLFEVSGDLRIKFENSIRLCFSYEEETDLLQGVVRLGKAIEKVQMGGGVKEPELGKKEIMNDLTEFR
jgi:DNA-binding transcriptional MocR family regulator